MVTSFQALMARGLLLSSCTTAICLSGCAHMNNAQSGALFGTGAGAIVGSAIGSNRGHPGAGALIGGITGAMAGSVIGDAEDAREERDSALAQRDAAVAQAQYVASQPALSNFDLIRLSQSGVGDDVIVNMIHTRGGQFDLQTDSIISLKSNGVSDRVIVAAQSAGTVKSPGMVMVQPAVPQTVIVEQAPPPIIVGGGWGWGGPYHRHYHRPYRSRVGMSIGF